MNIILGTLFCTNTYSCLHFPICRDFTRMNPSEFHGSKVQEYPLEFIDEVYKVLVTMRVISVEKAELVAYQLKGVAQIWYNQWKESILEARCEHKKEKKHSVNNFRQLLSPYTIRARLLSITRKVARANARACVVR